MTIWYSLPPTIFCKIFLYQIDSGVGVGCGIFFRADDSPIGADEPHPFS